jgi:ankyrin repeat protein
MRDARRVCDALWVLLLCSVGINAGAAERGALLAAAKHGTAAEVSDLLADEADADEADADGTTALHWAAHNGDLEAATALLAAGAAPDVANRYGVRPTYLAAENGDEAMMRALLAAGADPHATFAEGETLLMTASRTGNVPTMEAVIGAGVDVDAVEARGGQTALMSAAAENNAPAVDALIAAGAERDARDATGEFTALAFAARGGAVDATRALLAAGADANAALGDGTSMLVLAAINANYEVMSLLLDYGADAKVAAPNGWTPLHYIARVRRWNRGFNLPGPEHRDQMPSLAVARKLVMHGADVNARLTSEDDAGATPFLFATKFLDLAYMRTLLELGADPELTTDDGTTAVMFAAGVGQGFNSAGNAPGSIEEAMAAVELTLEIGGGTVNDVNKSNETPLHGAMYRGGSLALIDLLIGRGAKLELVANSRGWTPLRIADGVALDGSAFIRYPDAAAHLRELMQAEGLPVPPVAWDGPSGQAAAAQ